MTKTFAQYYITEMSSHTFNFDLKIIRQKILANSSVSVLEMSSMY